MVVYDPDVRIVQAISTTKEFAPQTLTEQCSTQMVATHEALMFLKRTTLDGQTIEGADANVLRVTRLTRL